MDVQLYQEKYFTHFPLCRRIRLCTFHPLSSLSIYVPFSQTDKPEEKDCENKKKDSSKTGCKYCRWKIVIRLYGCIDGINQGSVCNIRYTSGCCRERPMCENCCLPVSMQPKQYFNFYNKNITGIFFFFYLKDKLSLYLYHLFCLISFLFISYHLS